MGVLSLISRLGETRRRKPRPDIRPRALSKGGLMLRPAGGGPYPVTIAFWLPPLVRALTTASLVTLAFTLAEALGPFWGALIASLPVSAGPAYVFLALDHSPDFVAASALSSFAANAATGLFLIVYGVLARHRPHWQSLGAAVLVWLMASVTFHQFAWTPVTALVLNLSVYGAGFVVLKRLQHPNIGAAPALKRHFLELPVRAIAVAVFVSVVVAASPILGARATGMAAVFPISLISLIVIVRPRIGGAVASLLAANALRSMLGFGMMLLALYLAILPFGVTLALVVAVSVSACWSGGLLLLEPKTPVA